MPYLKCTCQGTGILWKNNQLEYCGCQYGQSVKTFRRMDFKSFSIYVENWHKQAIESKNNSFVNYSECLEEILCRSTKPWVLKYIFENIAEKNLDIVYGNVVYNVSELKDITALLWTIRNRGE